MILKLTKYTNTPGTFEAEWVNREVTPAVGIEGEEGYQPESTRDTTLRVIAYSGDQIDLFRAHVAQYGGEIDEKLLAEVQAEWVPPPPPPVVIPQSVTMRQARLALLGVGLLDDVDAAIAAIPDPVQRQAAQIEWEYATTVVRDSSWVQTLGASLNLTSAQIDELFIAAAKL